MGFWRIKHSITTECFFRPPFEARDEDATTKYLITVKCRDVL